MYALEALQFYKILTYCHSYVISLSLLLVSSQASMNCTFLSLVLIHGCNKPLIWLQFLLTRSANYGANTISTSNEVIHDQSAAQKA